MSAEQDPHPAGPGRFVGLTCTFQLEGAMRSGVVKAAKYAGRTARGAIPDYTLTIQGRSGRVVEVSLVETYAQFPST